MRCSKTSLRRLALLATLAGLVLPVFAFLPAVRDVPYSLPLLWPESQRAFLQDGPGMLLSAVEVEELVNLDAVGREEWIVRFYEDPDPATPENELLEGVRRRQALVRSAMPSMVDVRAQLLFLHGPPLARRIIDCAESFKPVEIWIYPSDPSESVAVDDGLVAGTAPPPAAIPNARPVTAAEKARRKRSTRKEKDIEASLPQGRRLVLYQENPGEAYKMWLPIDGKRVLYNAEMEYWLQQWEELRRQLSGGRRFDRQICDFAFSVDQATGIDGLYGFQRDRPKNNDLLAYLQPPDDREAWARAAAATPLTANALAPIDPVDEDAKAADTEAVDTEAVDTGATGDEPADDEPEAGDGAGEEIGGEGAGSGSADGSAGAVPTEGVETADVALAALSPPPPPPPPAVPIEALADPSRGAGLDLYFPKRDGQRLLTRALLTLPPELDLQTFVDGDKKEVRITVEGVIERDGAYFDTFRNRFQLDKPEGDVPVALIVDHPLRPNQEFLMRLKVIDEISGKTLWINAGFKVPQAPTPDMDLPDLPEEAVAAIDTQLKTARVEGYDSLILVPPETDVVFGLWRAEALVTGTRIQEVKFFLDETPQMTRRRPPFTAEMRLETYPIEQIVRAEGYDAEDNLVASDEVILNQPRGELRVRILSPTRGRRYVGQVAARAEVVVPEEQFVKKVEFQINGVLQQTLEKPPWETLVDLSGVAGEELVYLTVVAELDNGQRAEDVRFVNAPDYIEEVDVNLVELYTTVTDKSGRLVRGLTADDFEIFEDGRPQQIAKFELVEDLPLTLGIVIDSSGSMFESIGEARRAAVGFLENIITPRDRCFALAFADRPALLMPRTSDVGAVAQRVQSVAASGATALHDAVVTSLYYFRGVRGRRAVVLLSDGEDTASSLEYRETLEYAKRSGVAIYAIGLRIGRAEMGVRRKLEEMTSETGGRTFFIKDAAELALIYDEIEEELRSQYLVAYSSDKEGSGEYREVEVEVEDGKLKARTIRGYYS